MKRVNLFTCIITVILLALLISSCNNPASSAKSSISGSIVIVDVDDNEINDFSDVTIALYKKTELDTSLTRIYGQHPNIGFAINQETEFDHRLEQVYKTKGPDANGLFEFSNIPEGTYNLVVIKGTDYYCKRTGLVTQKDNDLVLETLQLNPVQKLAGFYVENFVFQADQVYLIEDDCTFLSQVEINGGSGIYIQKDRMISFTERVGFNGIENNKYWVIDTASGLFDITVNDFSQDNYFASVQFRSPNQLLKGGIIKHSLNGINISGQYGVVEDMDINGHDAGISFGAGPAQIKRVCIRNTTARGLQMMSMTDSVYVANSVFYNNHDALIFYSGGGFFAKNNYFQNNDIAIYPQNCEGLIQNNAFYNNSTDIYQYIARATIEYNDFFYSKALGIYPRTWAKINNNNFYTANGYFIYIKRKSTSSGSCVLANLDAKQNYWKPQNIDPYILDARQNDNYPSDEQIRYYVLTEPRLSRPVAGAGVK